MMNEDNLNFKNSDNNYDEDYNNDYLGFSNLKKDD